MSIPMQIRQALAARSLMGVGKPTGKIIFLDKTTGENTIAFCKCEVDHEPAADAQKCTITFPNVNPANTFDRGYYSPDRGGAENPQLQNEWFQKIMPGANVQVMMGYGTELTTVFTGQIDEITMSPDDSLMTLECRDYGCLLLDQRVDDGTEEFYLAYEGMEATDIVKDLLLKAGIPENKMLLEKTGIIVDFIELNSISFASSIAKVAEIAVFEFFWTEDGYARWQPPADRQPQATDTVVLLNQSETQLSNYPISKNSEKVKIGDTTYSLGTDYNIEWGTGKIYLTEGSSIPDGATVTVNYVYAAHVFRAGVDLIKMPYKITRRDIYSKIIVNGDGVQAVEEVLPKGKYGLVPNNILTANCDSITEQSKVSEAAKRYMKYNLRKIRQINFQSVGIPWIHDGDCIQVIEPTTTASEIYRLSGYRLQMDDSGFTMSGTCYHYGYTDITT